MEKLHNRKKQIQRLSARDIESNWSAWGPEEDIHLFIITCIANQKLLKTYLGLLDHIKRIRTHYVGSFSPDRFNTLLTEHIAILDALIEKNPERAEMAVQNHLRNAAAYLLRLSSLE
jgi:DNA-binding FadR family transcriptional regulator